MTEPKPTEEATNKNKRTLVPFGESLWIVEGPEVSFFGFPYPTRMVVAAVHTAHDKTTKRGAWIWSPIDYTEELKEDIEKATGGPVRYIVSPNYLHHLFLKTWQDQYPDALIYAPPGLEKRKVVPDNLQFSGTLSEKPPTNTYESEIDQVVFRGGMMDEVVFYHKPSKTVIFCDLIQRFPEDKCTGWKGWLMKMDGLVGPHGSTPRELRLTFWLMRGMPKVREALQKVLQVWKPEKLIIAHGDCATSNAVDVIEKCLSWMRQ